MSLPVVCDLDAALHALEGDRHLLSRMIEVFLGECPALLNATTESLARRDARALERSAHTLRGALSNFGAHDAIATLAGLEKMARAQDWHAAASAHAQLESAMPQVTDALAGFNRGDSP